MTNLILQHPSDWDWRRVGAWSSSLLAHAVAVALLALPTDDTWRPIIEPPSPTLATLLDPPSKPVPEPPPLPMPAPIQRPPKAPARTRPAVPSLPSPVQVQVPLAPPVSLPLPVATSEPGEPPRPPTLPASGAGITQELGYAQPVRPAYPPTSVRAREQGRVVLRVLVDIDGTPKTVEVERSSGHARLDAAARDAVRRSRFHPVTRGGVAVAAWGRVPIEFRLGDG